MFFLYLLLVLIGLMLTIGGASYLASLISMMSRPVYVGTMAFFTTIAFASVGLLAGGLLLKIFLPLVLAVL